MIKTFSDIMPERKPVRFNSVDWRALENLAIHTGRCDLKFAEEAFHEIDATVIEDAAEDAENLIPQMQDVMSVVIKAVRDGKISTILQPATRLIRRKGKKSKHNNPYALIGEVTWQWPRPQALDYGVILQYATRHMVKPKDLKTFIDENAGIQSCLRTARTLFTEDAIQNSDASDMGPVSRLNVALPEGMDLRKLIQTGEDILVLVKPQAGGSAAQLVTSDPLAKKFDRTSGCRPEYHQNLVNHGYPEGKH
tara:strand:- start:163 stop:915 length:753 start_codon:yes stop_codon:yes gene_type:complete